MPRPYNVYKVSKLVMGCVMEKTIGATDLRQQLTDVLIAVREEQAVYIVETFNRPQAALVNLDEYRQFQQYRRERDAFFLWVNETATGNAQLNQAMSEDDVLRLIEQARCEPAEPGV